MDAAVLGAAAISSGAVFLIPFLVWAQSPGAAVGWNSYSGEGFDFLATHFFAALFSINRHGVLIWHPIFLLAAIGLWFFFMRHPRLALPLLVPLFLQCYLIASWWGFSFGAGFGNRGFFTVYPLLLPGLAALLEKAIQRGRAATLLKLLLGLTLWNLLLMLGLSAHVIPAQRVFGPR